jgi:hypothetical protein
MTYKNKPVLSYFVTPTKDGIILGVKSRELGDVHLTLLWKNGKIGYHIADKTKEGIDRYPMDQHLAPSMITTRVERIVKPWSKLRPYHPRRKAWVMKPKLERTVREFGAGTADTASIPVELDRRLENSSSWSRVGISSLIGKGRIALVEDRGSAKFVIPIDKKQMIAISVRGYASLVRFMGKVYGLDAYFDYVMPSIKRTLDRGIHPRQYFHHREKNSFREE